MFRVEKMCGTGPYFDEDADNPMLSHMRISHGDAEHPSPAEDPILGSIAFDEACGFATLCALEEWFAGYEDVLAELGYEITVYTVPLASVRYGQQQAVFVKDHAVPVRTLSLL